ncbi:MAG TPA: sugar phosphate isomerase/epimerase [Capsulimonadaceae bacterium]|nr:sugar phosphate isomerase/epimerase [Capsulimonadaceae bacterium]
MSDDTKKIPIGLQLYSIREDCAKDLPGCLKAVAGMGYAGVEFAGYYNYSAKDLRRLLDENNLICCGTHTGLNTLQGDELARTIEFNQTLGNPYLIVPWIDESLRSTKAGWLQMAQLFNEISDKVEPQGMHVGYHNHHVEFSPLEGELPWDTFFGNTKDAVIMQFDTGNAIHGGAQAAPFLRRYPGRATTVHLKEFSETNKNALIGDGDTNWTEIFDLCETVGGTKWYIVEQESYAYPPLECVDKCLQNLRKMGK